MNTKIFLILAAAMGLTVTAEAQTTSFGPRVGANFSTLRVFEGEKVYPPQYKENIMYTTGAQFGAVVNISLSGRFSIQPEILYSQKGYKAQISFVENDPVGDMREKLRMNYLEVPVLAKLSFGSEKLQGFLSVGPSLGYWMNGKSDWSYAGLAEKEDYEFKDD